MARCANCEHPVESHCLDGCDYFGQGGGSCICPFEYNRATDIFGEKENKDSVATYEQVANPDRVKAADRQVGGDHYRQTDIQPWDIWKAYGLDPWQAGIIKYILRAGRKENVPALQDYEKARHYLDYLIEQEQEKN